MKPTLIFATGNPHKLQEVRDMLGDQYDIKGLTDIGCTEEIPETSPTIEGNALQKARYLVEHYGLDCFAEDTGLEVAALNGAPGVFSARYAGPEKDSRANMELLLRNLQEHRDRSARFRTVIALIRAGGEFLFEGIVHGMITPEPRGEGGFGYDPVFRPEGADRTFAEMDQTEKNRISHRARVTRQLIDFLQGEQPT